MRNCYLFLCFCIILLQSCSQSEARLGGSTETVGVVYDNDGKPVSGATILVVPDTTVLHNGVDYSFDTLYSDGKGMFTFEDIADGNYNLQYKKASDGVAFRRSITVKESSVLEFEDDTLRDTLRMGGELSGVVQLQKNHNSQLIYILFLGTNRFATPYDADGNFVVSDLAEGVYDVRFITSVIGYEAIDTVVTIKSDMTEIMADTIRLPYVGVAVPKNLQVSYDVDLQWARLTWEEASCDNTLGYFVYRAEDEDWKSYSMLHTEPRKDPHFIDSTGEQNKKYFYSVVAVSHEGNTSKKCSTVSQTFETSYSETVAGTLLCGANRWGAIALSEDGLLYSVCRDSSALFVLDVNTLELVERIEFPQPCKPRDITIVEDGSVLVATNEKLYQFYRDTEKVVSSSIATYNIESHGNSHFYYSASYSSYRQSENAIVVHDIQLGKNDTIVYDEERVLKDFTIHNDMLYVVWGNEHGRLTVECSSINDISFVTLFSTSFNSGVCKISANAEGISLLCNDEVINFIHNKKVSKTTVHENAVSMTSVSQKELLIKTKEGELIRYTRNTTQNNTDKLLGERN